ncbi:hypothetical protein MENTO_v1c04690 [Mesoplasma entomophilum]|uniref:Uncharacterized protein n=1 Tax=Mesoplasma entomophilum TaxID=2149 RepID=A0A3S5XZN1_9MOLU|nr:hypothetical protein [Mesoplasma entomophilum]ATQ35605.1 hypothetical protein CS528_02430 [Mesoplasma entomophilum]ATZ19574.1 hypothetical protein MENTO_v1c04690 [Mesoplasma entomophilum]
MNTSEIITSVLTATSILVAVIFPIVLYYINNSNEAEKLYIKHSEDFKKNLRHLGLQINMQLSNGEYVKYFIDYLLQFEENVNTVERHVNKNFYWICCICKKQDSFSSIKDTRVREKVTDYEEMRKIYWMFYCCSFNKRKVKHRFKIKSKSKIIELYFNFKCCNLDSIN